MKHEKTRVEILREFYDAPAEALFSQQTLCSVLNCSDALAERNRWAGSGVPFLKMGRSVRYRKSDIIDWIELHKPMHS